MFLFSFSRLVSVVGQKGTKINNLAKLSDSAGSQNVQNKYTTFEIICRIQKKKMFISNNKKSIRDEAFN